MSGPETSIIKTIAKLIDWLVREYGREVITLTVQRLKRFWYRRFVNQNILILGAKATGKSSLIMFMQKGKPFEMIRGEIHPPDPTAAAVLIGKKVPLEERVYAKVSHDLGGDPSFRHQWKEMIRRVQPDGIIYMIDGRLNEGATSKAIDELFQDVLSEYGDGQKRLKALHVFINFADKWRTSPESGPAKITRVMNLFEEQRHPLSNLGYLRVVVTPTQLSPNQKEWSDTKCALLRFAADLTS